MSKRSKKSNLLKTSEEIHDLYNINLNHGYDSSIDFRQNEGKNRHDEFSGVCPVGLLDVAYINAEKGTVSRGNQFSADYYQKKVFVCKTALPKAKSVSFLNHTRIFD